MADSTIIKPSETKNVSEIFLNHAVKIKIPRYQREYVWGEEQWTDLVEDIFNTGLGEVFLGFLLVHHDKDGEKLNVLNIVDGQQRILTISIFLSILAELEQELSSGDSYIRDEVFNQTFKGIKFQKVSANIGKDYLDKILYRGDKKAKPEQKSEIQLFECYEFLSSLLRERIKNKEEIEKIYDRVKNDITFSVTSTDTYEKAIRLFQVLNDNSVKLSSVDLFKNFLLSELGSRPDSELDEFAGKWNSVQAECSTKRASFQDYLLRFAMSRLGYFKHNDLYEKLSKIYQDDFGKNPEKFMEYIEGDIYNYLQVFSHDSIEIDKTMFQEVKFLIKVFNSLGANEPLTFFYTLFSVMASNDNKVKHKNKLTRELFRQFLNFTIVRYKLNGSGRAYMHQTYPSWSQALQNYHWTEVVTIDDILGHVEIKKINEHNLKYFDSIARKVSVVEEEIVDLTYSSNRTNKKFNKNEILVRYLLSIFYFGDDVKQIEDAFLNFSIEHIANDSDKSFGECRYQIGNLMLVHKDHWGSTSFDTKMNHYKLEKHVQDVGDIVLSKKCWGKEEIDERGRFLAQRVAKFLK